jgi:Uma2 family endonuclease
MLMSAHKYYRPVDEYASMLADFTQLEVLPGHRAELVDGEIIVSPTPDGQHETIVVAIDDWVRGHGTDLRSHHNLTLSSPLGEYVPDCVAAPRGAFASDEWRMETSEALMVAEVTSRRPGPAERDRVPKRLGYATAGIPLYLLVDRDQGRITIFSDPRGGDYRRSASVVFGESLEIPEPLPGILETKEFLR